jgi:hypothetical protein
MSRLSVLAIVLMLGMGPHAYLLCHTWCAGDVLPQECHQELASTAVAAADCCDGRVTNLTALRSAESCQNTVSPNQQTVADHHPFEIPVAADRISHRHELRGLNDHRLVTVLRI